MFSLRINTISGIQQATFASMDGCSIVRFYDSDSIRLRTKLDGSIKFYGITYDLLQQLRDADKLQTDIYLDLDGVEIYSGKLQLQGEWRLNEKVCSLSVEIDDEYTLLLRNIDVEFNWVNNELNSRTQVKTSKRNEMQSASDPIDTIWPDPETANCNDERYSVNDVSEYDSGYFYRAMRSLGTGTGGTNYYSGDVQFSYCKVSNNVYGALKSGVLVNPTDVDQTDWVDVTGLVTEPTGFPRMTQIYAPINFKDAILSEYWGDWVLGTCVIADQQWYFESRSLRDMLENSLQTIDSSLTVGAWDLGNIYVYNNDIGERFALKFEEIIGIYMMLFNVDWRLENNEFWFRSFTESEPTQPIDYNTNEYQYIDRLLAKDWSSQVFTFDLKNKVNEVSWQIDDDSFYIDFLQTFITYDNFYESSYDISNNTFVLDIAGLTRTDDKKIAVIKQDGADFMINDYGLEGYWVYNYGLSLYNLVRDNHKYGREFKQGVLSYNKLDFKEELSLIENYNEVNKINIPISNPFLIDFSLYLKSSFGDLKCIEIQTNLGNGQSIITAAK